MRRMVSVFFILLVLMLLAFPISAKAEVKEYEERPYLEKVHVTCYLDKGLTASGTYTNPSVCAVSREQYKKWKGKTLALYQRIPKEDGVYAVGKLIGYYTVLDNGCKGNVVDIWCPDQETAQAIMDLVYEHPGEQGKAWALVLDAEG